MKHITLFVMSSWAVHSSLCSDQPFSECFLQTNGSLHTQGSLHNICSICNSKKEIRNPIKVSQHANKACPPKHISFQLKMCLCHCIFFSRKQTCSSSFRLQRRQSVPPGIHNHHDECKLNHKFCTAIRFIPTACNLQI